MLSAVQTRNRNEISYMHLKAAAFAFSPRPRRRMVPCCTWDNDWAPLLIRDAQPEKCQADSTVCFGLTSTA